ncbi:hypothetical protein JTE90_008041 [Oedothorax gibbosus]|uniref:Hymenoptaecin n=1 Tax=Oedothorax gibbosus TaxID=931172 RepID=A0AAV6UYY1_9ARAC|nr:hypothetical protein JTE90_008041 [Oedothorax gibbosus]
MKGYLLVAFTLTIQAVTHALSNAPLSNYRNYNPLQYQGSPRLAISGRRDTVETLQHEQGNIYRGQREGRFLTRNQGDNYRGIQYAVQPQGQWSAIRGQAPSGYSQGIRRYQDVDSYAYGGRQPTQIRYSAPLANTRGFSPRFDASGNQQNEYRYY